MPLEPHDQKRLIAAIGYLELGMYLDANAELDSIDPLLRALPEVMTVRLEAYRQARSWDLMEVVARHLVKVLPERADHWVNWGYASRRSESIQLAKNILVRSLDHHPTVAIILYNLACYECQLGNIEDAQEYLKQTFKADPSCRLVALDDSDLEPLWSSLRKNA